MAYHRLHRRTKRKWLLGPSHQGTVIAKKWIKNTNFVPTHQKLGSCIPAKATDINAGKWHAGESHVKQHGQTFLQVFKPGSIVTEPDCRVSLYACAGSTSQYKRPF